MSAPTYVNVGTGSETAPGIPAGVAAHDVYIMGVETNNAGDNALVDTPSGWELITAFENFTPNHTRLSMFVLKDATGSELAPTITGPNSFNHIWAKIAAFRGANNSTPFHGLSVHITNALAQQWLPGSRTLIDDCLIAQWASYNNDSAGPLFSGETNADLSSLSERSDDGTATGNGGGLALWTGVKSSKGPFGPTAVTMSTGGALNLVTICLQPAGALFLPTLGQASRIKNTRM